MNISNVGDVKNAPESITQTPLTEGTSGQPIQDSVKKGESTNLKLINPKEILSAPTYDYSSPEKTLESMKLAAKANDMNEFRKGIASSTNDLGLKNVLKDDIACEYFMKGILQADLQLGSIKRDTSDFKKYYYKMRDENGQYHESSGPVDISFKWENGRWVVIDMD